MFGFKRSMVQAVTIISWTLNYFTFDSPILWSLFTTLLVAAVLLTITTYDHDYWRNRGVFSPPGWPVVGHILSVVRFKEQGGMCFKRIYETYRNVRFVGTHQFYQRTLVICDPELIKRICVNDFQHFVDRGFFFNKDVDPLAGSVLFLRGNEWRKLRAKISPIFSPIKLRGMFPLIDNTAKDFVVRIKELIVAKHKENSKENGSYNVENYENNSFSNGIVDKNTNRNFTKENDSHSRENDKRKENRKSYDTNREPVSKQTKDIKILAEIDRNIDTNLISKRNASMQSTQDTDAHKIDKLTEEYNAENKENTRNEIKTATEKIREVNAAKKVEHHKEVNEDDISADVDSEKLVGGYTADAIVPCAFGLKSSVMYNEDDPFAVALQAFYEMSFFNIFEKTMRQFWPAFVLFFRMRIIPKKTHDFFYNIVTSVLRARERGAQEKRGDFIDMMMALRSDDSNNNCKTDADVEITDMVISANAFIIFLGGFETTSSTLAFLLLELAVHEQVQEKMREEIRRVAGEEEITYEILQQLSYMEMVIQETLRLYPPFPSIQRLCTKDYPLPDSTVVVERGTIVLFPTLGIQRDDKFFEDGKAFVPDRWSEGRLPPPAGVYMPFGDGPRYCIGKRFAMIQMKCCLVRLLRSVRVSPARASMLAERRCEPFAADPRSPLTLHPKDSLVKISLL